MPDIVLPDDLYSLVLKPIAKKLGVRYIAKNPKLLTRKIFQALSSKSDKYNLEQLQPIKEELIKIVSVVSGYMEIGAVALRPLFQIIPPQYMIIIIAIILGITVFWPAQFLGVVLYYLAEKNLKIPYVNIPKKYLDRIPPAILNDTFIVEKVIKRTIKTTIPAFYKNISGIDFEAFVYEAPGEFMAAIAALETYLKYYPDADLANVDLSQTALIPEFSSIDFTKIYTLEATFYSGKRRILPPVLTRIVAGIKTVFENIRQLGADETGAIYKIAKFFLFGVWGWVLPDGGET